MSNFESNRETVRTLVASARSTTEPRRKANISGYFLRGFVRVVRSELKLGERWVSGGGGEEGRAVNGGGGGEKASQGKSRRSRRPWSVACMDAQT